MLHPPLNGHLNPQITIRDIADRAGVALTTVSSALHGRGRVGEAQKCRIQQIARDLGYQPKLAAQMLRSSTTGCIGLLLPGAKPEAISQSGHSGPILAHFVKACESNTLRYHVEFIKNEENSLFVPPAQIAGGMVDGVLVGGYVSPQVTTWLDSLQFPWVSVDEPARHCVLSADDEGIYQAVQKLAALGHRRIAFAGGPQKFETHRAALDGFKKAEKEFHLTVHPQWIQFFEGVKITRRERLHEACFWGETLLGKTERPSAVICHDMVVARGLIYQASKMGVEIPRYLSIIAVGLAADAEKALPCISTIEVNFEEIVTRALDLLQACLAKRQTKPSSRRVPPHLVMRDTVSLYTENKPTRKKKNNQ